MSRFASLLISGLAILLLGALAFYAYTHEAQMAAQLSRLDPFQKAPCAAPLHYAIGSVDPRFSLTTSEVEAKLAQAAALWNAAAGKTVLSYDPSDPAAMPVNFVYDSRQQSVALGQRIDSTEASQSGARSLIEAEQQQYLAAQQTYADAVASFNAESQAYAAEVRRVNAAGGADPATYDRLNEEKQSLKEKQQALAAQGSALDAQGTALKAKIDAYNASVRDINQVVNEFNSTAGGDFEEGQYVRDASGAQHIDIYAYKDQDELLHSLAHEFGHSLGLDHNQNPESIMFPYNKSSIALSADDLAALKAACKLP